MTNLQDITLQSMDGVLVAKNEMGHLTYPMLHLNRQPVPEDAQGWDRVLVFVDGDGTIAITENSLAQPDDCIFASPSLGAAIHF